MYVTPIRIHTHSRAHLTFLMRLAFQLNFIAATTFVVIIVVAVTVVVVVVVLAVIADVVVGFFFFLTVGVVRVVGVVVSL